MDEETLSADELAYHRNLLAALKSAQAAWQSWSGHLAAKYALGPSDAISEAGEVVRNAPAPLAPAAEEGDRPA